MNKIGVLIFFLLSSFAAVSQTVDFTFQTSDGLFCNPAIVQFSATASETPKAFIWNFGNGTITNGQDPEVVFSNPGTYNVKIVAVYANKAVTITKQVTINPVVAATLQTDRNFICTPGAIKFVAKASGVSDTYFWDFGDGSSPVSSAFDTLSHTFSAKQIYNVKLKVVDSSGCFDTASTQITLMDPIVSGTITPTSGCIPATVSFSTKANIPPLSNVANYKWDFGDGDSFSTNATSSTNYVYPATGVYSTSVTITTNEGCTGSFKYPTVAFGTPPTNPAAYPYKTVICGSETAQFVGKATKANSY
ncbi:MAG: PKD domain-containing protein, partial [Ginsengibacter sp.]